MKAMYRYTAIGFLGCLLVVVPASAQQAAPATPEQGTQNIDPKSFAVAKEIVKSFDMSSILQNVFGVMTKTILPLIMRDNPNQSQQIQRLAFDTVQKTFQAHMPELENNKAIVFAQMYSYDELQQLKKFYQSPVGQKTLKTMPEMLQRSMMLDQNIILKAMDESKRSIADELRRNGMNVPREMDM